MRLKDEKQGLKLDNLEVYDSKEDKVVPWATTEAGVVEVNK